MAVLTKEELLKNLSTAIGENTTDEVIKLMEDASDTLNDLDTKARGDGKDWKAEADRIDKEWREKYRNRFFSGSSNDDDNDFDNDNDKPKKLTFENLFKEG